MNEPKYKIGDKLWELSYTDQGDLEYCRSLTVCKIQIIITPSKGQNKAAIQKIEYEGGCMGKRVNEHSLCNTKELIDKLTEQAAE